MIVRIDSTDYYSGVVIGNVGLGVFAEDIPSTGDAGASFLYNDVTLPADNGKQIRAHILTLPTAGTLFVYEDGSFTFTGATDGAYTFTYQLYVDGVSTGSPATVSITVGDSGTVTNVTVFVKVGGTYVQSPEVYVKVGGVYKLSAEMFIKLSGVYSA